MKINTLTTFLLLAAILVSCAKTATNAPSVLFPISSATPTFLQVPPASNYPNDELECIQPERVQGLPSLDSTLVTFDKNSKNIELWNLKTDNKIVLGRVEILSGAMANFQKVVYIDADEHQMKIVSPTGEILSTISAPENWVEILGWINDKNLLIGNMPFLPNGGWYPPSSIVINNMDSGEIIEFSPKYPNIYGYASGPPHFGYYSYSLTAYDPSLTRVVYPASTSDYEYLVLWNILEHREIARFYISFPFSEIRWNKDGTFFIAGFPPHYEDTYGNTYKNVQDELPYVGGNELFLISKNGGIERLTNLTTKFVIDEYSFSWSPNSDYVAFWLKIGVDTPEWQLAVLKLKTGEITSSCIDHEGTLPIIWSPDGDQIMSTTHSETLLIDIQENKFTVWSTDDRIVIGWFDNIH